MIFETSKIIFCVPVLIVSVFGKTDMAARFVLHIYVIILWPLRFGWLLVLGLYKEDYLQM